jgi:hypothetical protein
LQVLLSSCSLQPLQFQWWLQWWFHCQVIHNYEASLELILFENPWWVLMTAVYCIKQMLKLFDKQSHTSTAPNNNTVCPLVFYRSLPRCGWKEGGCWGSSIESLCFEVVIKVCG